MSFEFRKIHERGLSSFTARELFLDYIESRLDSKTTKELDRLLENDVSLRLDFEKFQNAVKYCQWLKDASVSKEILEEISSAPSSVETISKKLNIQRWPNGLRWGAEALVIVSFLLMGVLVIPWSKIIQLPQSDYVTLAEVERGNQKPSSELSVSHIPGEGAVEKFEDDGATPPKPQAEKAPVGPITPELSGPRPPYLPEAPLAKAKTVAKNAVVNVAPSAAQAPQNPLPTPTAASTEAAVAKNEVSKNSGGFLYRGIVDVHNLDAVSPKFVEYISELGGRKAGEVDLGWVKGTTRYFHFTIPEAKYESFVAFANQYGKMRINREPHPRVMPEGIVRIILVVGEKGQNQ